MEEHLVRVHSDIYFLYVKSWYGGVKLESMIKYLYTRSVCTMYDLTSFCEVTMSIHVWGQRSFLGHVWPSELTMHEIRLRDWDMMWKMQLEVTHEPGLTFDLKHTHCDLSAWRHQWRSQMGSGGRPSPGRNSGPPLAPMKSHFVQRSMVSCHFESQSAPPHLSPPCRPLILKSGYAPGCHTVTPYNFKAVLIFIDLAQLHFCLAHKNSHRVIFDRRTSVNLQVVEDKMLIYLDKRNLNQIRYL